MTPLNALSIDIPVQIDLERTYTIEAPPPPEPRQPISWQPRGVAAMRNPINALSSDVSRIDCMGGADDSQGCWIPESFSKMPLDSLRRIEIQFL